MARGSGSRGTGTFGLTSSGRGNKYSSNTRFRGGRGRGGSNFRGRGGGRGGSNVSGGPNAKADDNAATQTEGSMLEARFEEVTLRDEVDSKLGFPRMTEGLRREGWLVNMFPVCVSRLCFLWKSTLMPSFITDPRQGPRLAQRSRRRRLLLHRR